MCLLFFIEEGYLRVDPWSELLSDEGHSRDFFWKNSPLVAHFSNTEGVAKLAYSCDIFHLFKELNLSLQEKMTTVLKLAHGVAVSTARTEL